MDETQYWQNRASSEGHYSQMIFQSEQNAAVSREELTLFAMLKPKIYPDGNAWCVLLGDNIVEGVVGFGDTPFKAIMDFTAAFHSTVEEAKNRLGNRREP